jgi:hypothetical protein
MNNVTFIDVLQSSNKFETFAIIDRGNGEFTSMLKSTYETLLSNSSIPQAGE